MDPVFEEFWSDFQIKAKSFGWTPETAAKVLHPYLLEQPRHGFVKWIKMKKEMIGI